MIFIRPNAKNRVYLDPQGPRYISNTINSQRAAPGTIKIVTFNIKFSRRINEALLLLQKPPLQNVDILCLQEMDLKGVSRLAEGLHCNFVYYPALFHPWLKQDFGNAILCPWPIVKESKIVLPYSDSSRFPRIAVKVILTLGEIRVAVFCTHTKVFLSPRQRGTPVEEILKYVPDDTKHCIVAGDFNTFTRADCEAVISPMKEAGFDYVSKDAGFSYTYWYLFNKKAALDHIFVKGMKKVTAGVVLDKSASDHFPVWAEAEI